MTSDFDSARAMGEWARDQIIKYFSFLDNEFGFKILSKDVHSRGCDVEYKSNDIQVGIWAEFGERPEVFVETGGKRVFTGQLISKYAKGLKLPVKSTVFEKRTTKADYRSMFDAYSNLVRICVQAERMT